MFFTHVYGLDPSKDVEQAVPFMYIMLVLFM